MNRALPIKKEFRPLYRTPQWFAAREAVRARAGDRCEACGAPNGSVVVNNRLGKEVRIQCGCAHINNVPGDDRLDNLAWWCRGCHLRHDVPFHAPHARETRSTKKDRARPLLAAVY